MRSDQLTAIILITLMEEKKKRKRRILPRIPEELESSRTSLEESREERSSEPARESSSSSTTTTTTITELTRTWNVIITHLTQTIFTCPACGVSYHVNSSLQRHMRDHHKDGKVTWIYVRVPRVEKNFQIRR